MKKLSFVLFYLLLTNLSAQEICNDGVDNDFDGFVDCFDNDCMNSASCAESFFGNDASCQINPTEFPNFKIRQKWASANGTSDNTTYPAIGDLDGDGVPEVVVGNILGETITILDGATGNTLNSITLDFQPARSMAIADITQVSGDSCGEIFVRASDGTNIEAYDCNLNLLWSINTNPANGNPGLLSLADFDGDGNVELFHHNEIINAATGVVIIPGNGSFETQSAFGTVAVDVIPDDGCTDCQGLELIDGNKIYAVDIGSGLLTEIRNMNDVLATTPDIPAGFAYFPKISTSTGQRSMMSPADFNQDGHIDLLLTGALGLVPDDQTTIFFWDITNETVDFYQDPDNNFSKGTGRITVADVDGDGKLNATFIMNQKLISLDENLDLFWTKGVVDGSSGISGCTAFDFNGDGASEILYRSERKFYIIDGHDGSAYTEITCQSRTWVEYPVVADIDGDGSTEICITCSSDDNAPFNPFSNAINGQVRVYESDGEHWLPSRSVWNQHAYFSVNINDDLTIPINQQDPTISFSPTLCDGTIGENQALNSFLGQSTLLNSSGCPNLAGNDIVLQDVTFVGQPMCLSSTFDVNLTLSNNGAFTIKRIIPVTFYNGDPQSNGAIRLNTELVSVENLVVGQTVDYTLAVELETLEFQLFIVVNDDGAQDLPLTGVGSVMAECDFENNIQNSQISALPFSLSVEKIADNQICDESLLANGAARTFVIGELPRDTVTLWFEDFEDLTDGDIVDNGETAWSFNSVSFTLAEARVIDTGTTKLFAGNDVDEELIWTSEEIAIDNFETILISVDLISSGILEENQDYLSFSYQIDGGAEILLSNADINGSIENNSVEARVTIPSNTGNTIQLIAKLFNTASTETYAFDNILVKGLSEPVVGEITEGFTFHWFEENNFSTILFEGSTQNNLREGVYSVIGINDQFTCNSDTASLTIGLLTNQFTIETVENSPVTNCASPNGSLTANILMGGMLASPEEYAFVWTLDFGIDTIASGPTASGLDAREYTVVVRELATGCIDSKPVIVSVNLVMPALEASVMSNVTDCANLLSGEVTANSNGSIEGFTFMWFDGENIKEIPNFVGATYSGLQAGNYTVIAIDNDSQCNSDPMTLTVLDETISPEIAFSGFVNNTNGNNGSVSLNVTTDGIISPDGYNFEFFSGENANPSNQLINGSPSQVVIMNISSNELNISGLSDGIYTVRVQDLTSDCFTIAQFDIFDEFAPASPVILSPEMTQLINAEMVIISGTAEEGTFISVIKDLNGNNMIDMGEVVIGIPFQLMDGQGDFSIEVPLIQNSVNNFLVTATDNSGNVSMPADVLSITEESIEFVWQGGAINAESDWGTASNWSGSSVPTSINDVLIPNTANPPSIVGANYAINNLNLADGVNLDIASGAGLAIMGEVTLEGSGLVNLTRNITDDLGYSTIGTPITTATIEELGTAFAFSYNETNNTFQNASGNMLPGQGYFVASSDADASVSFSGEPNTGVINKTLSVLSSGNDIIDGFNLVANPYAAAIDRGAFLEINDQNIINGTIWVWDDGGANNGSLRSGDYVAITDAGVTSINPDISFSTTTPIGSMQGFFVLASNHMANLTFNPSIQVISENTDQNFFRGEKDSKDLESVRISLQGRGKLADIYNELVVAMDENATFEDDFALDGLKFSGNSHISFYSLQKNKKYAVQAIPIIDTEKTEIELGFYLLNAGSYHLYLKELVNNRNDVSYFLRDRKTSKRYDISLSLDIDFEVWENSTINDRFVLEIVPTLVTIVDEERSTILSIIKGSRSGLTLGYPSLSEDVFLYDLSGKLLFEKAVIFENKIGEVDVILKADQVYLLKVANEVIKFSIKQ